MARTGATWAIDVGQCALKALRCRASEDGSKLVAEAFDYIEYPKILSQPGADAAELVGDALKQFLSRNTVKGDRVAISVPGQAGLARFIKLPPVEAKKIPDIVRFEARQQIPFDLNDVIWDYQRMGIWAEEEGYALETEVGLFAMKRDAVARALEPFQRVGIEVDVVQLAPLSIYNMVVFDQLTDLPPPDQYDPDNPPESLIVISVGTDATDLVITNGYRVWQRSVPIGGNHFTKALTKELKLTFAKAEHLKRNASSAEDPKAVFQAMRPVFSDLLTELNRSISYFTTLDRTARLGRVVALGNTMKLPGLRRYLSQNLGFEIERLENYRNLVGPQVVTAPVFKDNTLAFGVCYGLALQGLDMASLRTNLLPKEILRQRLISRKKPWAVAAAAILLLGWGVTFASYFLAQNAVAAQSTRGAPITWSQAESQAKQAVAQADALRKQVEEAKAEYDKYFEIGQHLVGNADGRLLWLELLCAINQALPRDEGEPPAEIQRRRSLIIDNIRCEQVEDAAAWYQAMVEKQYYRPIGGDAATAPQAAAVQSGQETMPEGQEAGGTQEGAASPISGRAWIVSISGHHFHNLPEHGTSVGAQYVRDTLVKNLETGKVRLPAGQGQPPQELTFRELGVYFPSLVAPGNIEDVELKIPATLQDAEASKSSAAGKPGDAKAMKVRKFDFLVQFCWKPVPLSDRTQRRSSEPSAQAQ